MYSRSEHWQHNQQPSKLNPHSGSWSEGDFLSRKFSKFEESHIVGVAEFDRSGFPIRHLGIGTNNLSEWFSTSFNVLCLKTLIESRLSLRGFQHLTIQGHHYKILLVKQSTRYIGFLLQKDAPDQFVQSLLQTYTNKTR